MCWIKHSPVRQKWSVGKIGAGLKWDKLNLLLMKCKSNSKEKKSY